jgi:DNA-binding NarL/FixJ family response regulator
MSDFHVLVAASHPTVRALFAEIARQHPGSVLITVVSLDARAVLAASARLAPGSVAVVDASVEPTEALAVCEAIRTHRPALPVSAVFCCAHSATAADLQSFLGAGVGGLLELELSAEDILVALRGIARGESALHVQLAAGARTSLLDRLTGTGRAEHLSDRDLGLLRLVALGLTDHEIGRQLYLSPHTIKHRIDRLRRHVHAKNRVQLAAWAGAQLTLRGNRPDPGPRGAAKVHAHPCGLVR